MTPISYKNALGIIKDIASQHCVESSREDETLPLHHILGRIAKNDILSPVSTSLFPSSAMDGYAVMSEQTKAASLISPVFLKVVGTTAAGSSPIEVNDKIDEDGVVPCVEIMTGAAFPFAKSTGTSFDACIPLEQTTSEGTSLRGERVLQMLRIDRAPALEQHHRKAGTDFPKGLKIVAQGSLIEAKHILALASVGIKTVAVQRNLRVGVISTGSELEGVQVLSEYQDRRYSIPDVNGPYLVAALREMGATATHLGAIADTSDELTGSLKEHHLTGKFDILIATGGVSAGKYDHVPGSITRLNGSVHFHHVAMKPGHPVLFATLPEHDLFVPSRPPTPGNGTAFFGFPGNPIASAACLRFLLTPYMRGITGRPKEEGTAIKVETPSSPWPTCVIAKSPQQCPGRDLFLHATIRATKDGPRVGLSEDQSSAKSRPFASANCWVHIEEREFKNRTYSSVLTYPLCSTHL